MAQHQKVGKTNNKYIDVSFRDGKYDVIKFDTDIISTSLIDILDIRYVKNRVNILDHLFYQRFYISQNFANPKIRITIK